jgi:hypothetical protein
VVNRAALAAYDNRTASSLRGTGEAANPFGIMPMITGSLAKRRIPVRDPRC